MGAADVIPGVSGGTIAFMTGIYEELIGSINSIGADAVKLLFTGKLKAFWKHINGNFLLALFAGILVSVLSLAQVMQYLLENHPIQTWAFFFGLIVASSIFILRGISGWKVRDIVLLVFGVALGVVVCTLSPTQTPDALWFIFVSGAIAICAMILPGISGSFILLILGKYEYVMGAISGLMTGLGGGSAIVDGISLAGSGLFWHNALILAVFALGAIVGILSFSKFLHWLLGKYHRATLLVLAGFIIGSLVKVYSWSNKADIIASQFGNGTDALLFTELWTQVDMHIGGAVLFAFIGFALVSGIELAGKMLAKRN